MAMDLMMELRAALPSCHWKCVVRFQKIPQMDPFFFNSEAQLQSLNAILHAGPPSTKTLQM